MNIVPVWHPIRNFCRQGRNKLVLDFESRILTGYKTLFGGPESMVIVSWEVPKDAVQS